MDFFSAPQHIPLPSDWFRRNKYHHAAELLRLLVTATFLVHRFLSPWWWRRYDPSKRRFSQEPHGMTSQKTPFFIVTAGNTSNLTLCCLFVCLQVSSDGNITYSTLTFTPTLTDHGKTLTCRAVNKFIDAAVEEDSWKLNVFCKYNTRRYFNENLSYSVPGLSVYFSSHLCNNWQGCISKQLRSNEIYLPSD
jgi:hypothetical protein